MRDDSQEIIKSGCAIYIYIVKENVIVCGMDIGSTENPPTPKRSVSLPPINIELQNLNQDIYETFNGVL